MASVALLVASRTKYTCNTRSCARPSHPANPSQRFACRPEPPVCRVHASSVSPFGAQVYPQHLPYGLTNKTVIALGRTPFVPVTQLTDAAPSAMLPEFAARYQPEPGRAFSYGPSREHPPGQDGQAKDAAPLQSLT